MGCGAIGKQMIDSDSHFDRGHLDLRRFLRTIRRFGEDSDVWPVVLLLFAVLVPAVCLLWFMGAAMRNERLAARQKLADVYRVQLSAAQRRLQEYWNQTA